MQRKLGQSATTIRRHLALAQLPPNLQRAIKEGSSAKKILAARDTDSRLRRMQQRIIADRKTGALSDQMADIVLKFCQAKDGTPDTPILKSELSTFLDSVKLHLNAIAINGQRFRRISTKNGIARLFNKTEPQRIKDRFWMDFQAEWMAYIIMVRTPERAIWESALQKAQTRSKELENQKSLRETLKFRNDRRILFRSPLKGRRY
jgi:hypothetical protein